MEENKNEELMNLPDQELEDLLNTLENIDEALKTVEEGETNE